MASPHTDSAHTTILFLQVREGDPDALQVLIPYVYDELYYIAQRQLHKPDRPRMLNTTALVHEVYLRLVDQTRVNVHDKSHFFALSATIMRQILIDQARKRASKKRGGDQIRVDLEGLQLPESSDRSEVLLALDEALTKLEKHDARMARLVEYRFFAGMSMAEIAVVMETSDRTLARLWRRARAYLYQALQQEG